MTRDPDFEVCLVVLTDERGRALVVRKEGTARFMNVGGKREPGESWAQAAVREVREETGLALDPDRLRDWGIWDAEAANEAGLFVRGHTFRYVDAVPSSGEGAPVAHGEIAELAWVAPESLAPRMIDNRCVVGEVARVRFAPMFLEHCVPALLAERA